MTFSPMSASRSNLLLAQQRLDLARQGHDLLQRKRDVLIVEILRLIDDAASAEEEAKTRFATAYQALRLARATMGSERVRRAALVRDQSPDLRITPHSVMGVVVPSVRCTLPPSRLAYGLGDTSVLLDEARLAWAHALALVATLAERVTTLWRLASELQRTQRRVNALENVFIPAYEETVRRIEETLEEKEREELFRLRRAMAIIQRRHPPSPSPEPPTPQP